MVSAQLSNILPSCEEVCLPEIKADVRSRDVARLTACFSFNLAFSLLLFDV